MQSLHGGFPGGSVVKNPLANAGDAGDAGLIPGLGSSPGGRMATHSSILAWLDWEDHLEKGLATHSSILAWRNPGGLQSMGSQRVRHD